MMSLLNSNGLKVIDTFKEYNGYSPVTYADTDPELGNETTLTYKDDLGSKMSLDYIFECFYDEEVDPDGKVFRIDKSKVKVERFLVDDLISNLKSRRKNTSFNEILEDKDMRQYTQLSDHYGLSCEISYNDKMASDLSKIKELKEGLSDNKDIELDVNDYDEEFLIDSSNIKT